MLFGFGPITNLTVSISLTGKGERVKSFGTFFYGHLLGKINNLIGNRMSFLVCFHRQLDKYLAIRYSLLVQNSKNCSPMS